jgi:1-aminocyclopropane-1-carboxylate deaminase/D-cysteine desulfhydrase-like pyridoxal-dependent ACC family enzyme
MNLLARRFPELEGVPWVDLGVRPSPVLLLDDAVWIKRDDLSAPRLGGNKVRALEYLFGARGLRSEVVTVGGVASTHVLATAVHAAALGLTTTAFRWPHHVHETGSRVSAVIESHCVSAPIVASPLSAFLAAGLHRLRHRELWIPFGATSPSGLLGHVAAAFELADQIEAGHLPVPAAVFCPLGTGGTAAGLALGLGLAGVQAQVVAVRVGPRTGLEMRWLRQLAWRTRRLLERRGVRVPSVSLNVRIDESADSGGYAVPHRGAESLAQRLAERGLTLDATYSAKACYAAFEYARGNGSGANVLFWHTFDSRWLANPAVLRRSATS